MLLQNNQRDLLQQKVSREHSVQCDTVTKKQFVSLISTNHLTRLNVEFCYHHCKTIMLQKKQFSFLPEFVCRSSKEVRTIVTYVTKSNFCYNLKTFYPVICCFRLNKLTIFKYAKCFFGQVKGNFDNSLVVFDQNTAFYRWKHENSLLVIFFCELIIVTVFPKTKYLI